MVSNAAHYQILITIDAGDSELFVYHGVTEPFGKLPAPVPVTRFNDQKQILDQAFSCITATTQPIQIPDPTILKALCRSASSQCYSANDLVTKIELLDPNHVPPLDTFSRQAITHSIRYILEYDLVADLDTIQPGTYALSFIDTKTHAPFDLYQFIMEEKQLQIGYMMALRDEELLSNYASIKAMLSKDPRTKEELQKLEQLSIPMQHGEHRHTLPNIRDFLRKNPDVGSSMLSHLDPSELILGPTHVVSTARLKTIATENVGKVAHPPEKKKDTAKKDHEK